MGKPLFFMTYETTFGDRTPLLKVLRTARGWSLRDLAKRVDCDHTTVMNWERGVPPSDHFAKRLSAVFETDVAMLLKHYDGAKIVASVVL
jgi:transcriptional regulator with XRE-family HTH domain